MKLLNIKVSMGTEILFALLAVISMLFALLAYRFGQVWLICYTAITLILANTMGPKVVGIFGFAITAGTPLFAGLPIATDLLAERYGVRSAQQAVYGAFLGMLFFSLAILLVLPMTALPFATSAAEGLDAVLGTTLRLMIASPVAYLIWQLIDIKIYEHVHRWSGDRLLWLRNNVSTLTAQAGSTLTFFALGFYGTETPWLNIAFVTICFYWIIALIDTVIVYAARHITPQDLR